MTNLFCGNISFDTDLASLEEHLSNNGVKSCVEVDLQMRGGRSRGWALLKFSSEEDANAAASKLNDTELDGRPLNVRLDRGSQPKEPRRPRPAPAARPAPTPAPKRAPRPAYDEEEADPSNRLFVGNLPWEATNQDVSKVFTGFEVVSVEVQKRLSGRSKGFALVSLKSKEQAQAALDKLCGQVSLEDRPLTIKFDRSEVVGESQSVFVGNLPWTARDEDLQAMFAGFDTTSAEVRMVNGRSKGFAIVKFSSMDEARRAIREKAEFEFEGRQIFTRFDRE